MKRKITYVVDLYINEILSMKKDGYTLLSIKNHIEEKINQKITYSNFIKCVAKSEKTINDYNSIKDIKQNILKKNTLNILNKNLDNQNLNTEIKEIDYMLNFKNQEKEKQIQLEEEKQEILNAINKNKVIK